MLSSIKLMHQKIEKPNPETLIGKQKEVFDTLINFYSSGETMFCLEGFAGTGKSHTSNMFFQHLLYEHNTRICVCAPNHKAVRVIRSMATFESDNLDYSTIHSLLGLRPDIDQNGNEIFVKDSQSSNKVEDYDLIVIDEGSQLNDYLFGLLMAELNKNPYLKIIFIGDGKQLGPIGFLKSDEEKKSGHKRVTSIPLDEKTRENFDIGHIAMTDIVRQKGSNPVIDFSKELREGVFNPRKLVNDKGQGIFIVKGTKQYRTVLKKMFCSENYDMNPDYCRVTAWTNNSVNHYNAEIRKMIYKDRIYKRMEDLSKFGNEEKISILKKEFPYYRNGKMELPKFLVGDKVIVDKPVFHESIDSQNAQIVYHTSEELVIEDILIDTRMGLGEVYKVYDASVKNLFDGQTQRIEMIHEDDEMKFEQHKERLRQTALAKPKKSKSAKEAWKIYYSLEKRFARLKYAPAITTHKSQGSTYENVIMLVPDMLQNRKKQELMQLLYVGVTRCQERAFLFV